jgi:hypothetical protein
MPTPCFCDKTTIMQSVALMLKRAFWAICLCLAIASVPLPSLAVTVKEVSNPQQVYGGWVTDTAHLLDCETPATLNQLISKLDLHAFWAQRTDENPSSPSPQSLAPSPYFQIRGGKWHGNCGGNRARDDTSPYPQAVWH